MPEQRTASTAVAGPLPPDKDEIDVPMPEFVEIAGKRYLPAHALAKVLGVTLRTLSRWDDARTGPPKIKIGRLVLYDEDKIPAWMAAHESQPARFGKRGRS